MKIMVNNSRTTRKQMKLDNSTNKNSIILYILVYLFFIVLSMSFCLARDDFFFCQWQFKSLKDLIVMSPVNKLGLSGVPYNGRYLGNTIGILLAKAYNTNLWIFRCIFIGTSIFVMIFLLTRLYPFALKKRRDIFVLMTFFIVAIPRDMFMQVISWGAAYSNYFLPMIGIVIIFYFLGKKKVSNIWYPVLFLVSISTQLFMETVTVYCAILSIVLIIVMLRKEILSMYTTVTVCFGIWVGAAIMFTSKGYSRMNVSLYNRSISISSIIPNLKMVCSEGIVYNLILMLLISYLLIKACRIKQSHLIINENSTDSSAIFQRNKTKYVSCLNNILIILNIYNIIINVMVSFNIIQSYLISNIIVAFAFIIIFCILTIFYLENSYYKQKIIFWGLSIFVVYGMLLLLTPIGARNCFIAYVFGIFICMELIGYLTDNNFNINIKIFKISAIALGVILYIVYFVNFYVIKERDNYIEKHMENNETVMYAPGLIFDKYYATDWNFLSVQHQYNETGDIQFYMVPYFQWRKLFKD